MKNDSIDSVDKENISKSKLWVVGIRQWFDDCIKTENCFNYNTNNALIATSTAHMCSFFEANVRADKEAAFEITEESDEEARKVVSMGKVIFLEEAPATMKRVLSV